MLTAVKGFIRGNNVIVENEDLRPYDGTEVVVTLLEHPVSKKQKICPKKRAIKSQSAQVQQNILLM